jgi:hypothetical protein
MSTGATSVPNRHGYYYKQLYEKTTGGSVAPTGICIIFPQDGGFQSMELLSATSQQKVQQYAVLKMHQVVALLCWCINHNAVASPLFYPC